MAGFLPGLLLAGLVLVPSAGWAFPGQTAEQLIAVLGPSANGYTAPPVPVPEAIGAGAQLSQIYWPRAAYDPLKSGVPLEGILVVTFDYRGADLAERVRRDPPAVSWNDLVSHAEVFLTFLSPTQFRDLLERIKRTWIVRSMSHRGDAKGYDLYTLASRDGTLQAEFSYADKGDRPPLADPAGEKPPTLNFWTRVSPAR